mgnify:FL=1
MARKIKLKSFKDERGILTVLDKEIKFKFKRVYYIYDILKKRGGHRHKKNTQVLIAVNGKCKIFFNDRKNKKNFFLNKKNECLVLNPRDWHTIEKFSKDCILLVLCSEKYQKKDYIVTPYKN